LIATTTQHEEELFRRTLKRGLSLLQENEAWETDGDRRVLPGHVAFKLYDTFGFPLDLQRVLGEEQGFSIDESRFDLELQAQRDRSRGSKVGDESVSEVYFQLHEQFGSTRFVGYESESAEGTVLALVAAGTVVAGLGTGEAGEVLVDTTPFYAEQGGQEGDRGVLQMDGAQFQVEDTVQPRSGCFVHRGRVISGTLDTGAKVTLSVDPSLRMATRRNHSATHLLHWALRETLGPAATQQGSLVGPNRLRFDYSGTRPLSQEEILEIEDRVNQAVFANTPVTTEVLPLDEAKARGAMGIFEEKYGAVVRMLRIGPSLELCGGTHAFRTGDIGLFKILSESGVAAGVRRIEASTGWNTVKRCRELERVLEQVAVKLKTPSDKLPERVQRLMEQTRESSAEVERLKRQLVQGDAIDLTKQARSIDGVQRLGAIVDVGDAKALREMAEHLRDRLAPAAVLLGSRSKDGTKALLACSVSKEVIKDLRAGDLVREAARIVGGGGGGRPDFAQAGGPKPECLPEAVASIYGPTTEGSATER
ncbi:MAG: alanine--tRNA ligase-related protein, partial [Myxococcota bacterium]